MKLIVGLGNPGRTYQHSRHNAGFLCISRFAHDHRIAFSHIEGRSHVGRGIVSGVELVLARPRTYMNRSGEAVALLLKRYRVSPADLVVVHDDLDLPLGSIRIRAGGSSGGHKGVESIIAAIGTPEFARIRVGIGRPAGDDTIDYVLGEFAPAEMAVVQEVVGRVSQALFCILSKGIEAAMSRFNRRPVAPDAGTFLPETE